MQSYYFKVYLCNKLCTAKHWFAPVNCCNSQALLSFLLTSLSNTYHYCRLICKRVRHTDLIATLLQSYPLGVNENCTMGSSTTWPETNNSARNILPQSLPSSWSSYVHRGWKKQYSTQKPGSLKPSHYDEPNSLALTASKSQICKYWLCLCCGVISWGVNIRCLSHETAPGTYESLSISQYPALSTVLYILAVLQYFSKPRLQYPIYSIDFASWITSSTLATTKLRCK